MMKSVFALLLSTYLITTALVNFTQSLREKRQVFYPYGHWWPGWGGLAYYRSDNTGSSNACRKIKCQQNEECHVQQIGFVNGTAINQAQCVPKAIPAVPAVRTGETSRKCGEVFCKPNEDCHKDHWYYTNGTKTCFSRCIPVGATYHNNPDIVATDPPPRAAPVSKVPSVKGHEQPSGTRSSPPRPVSEPKPVPVPGHVKQASFEVSHTKPVPDLVPDLVPALDPAPVPAPVGHPRQASPSPAPVEILQSQFRAGLTQPTIPCGITPLHDSDLHDKRCKADEECVVKNTIVFPHSIKATVYCVKAIELRAARVSAPTRKCGAIFCNHNEHCRIYEVQKANGNTSSTYHCVSDTGVTRSYPNPDSRYRIRPPLQ